MSVLKVVEILGNSTESWEDAVNQVLLEASKTIKNIKSVYIQDMQAMVKDNKVSEYRINAKVTFGILDECGKTRFDIHHGKSENISRMGIYD